MKLYVKFVLILILVSQLSISCVKKYEPNLADSSLQKLVVSSQINDQEGFQYVNVSLTTSLVIPVYTPVSGCNVQLKSDDGSSLSFAEFEPGKYQLWLADGQLDKTKAYQLIVITSDNQLIESTWESFYSCPDVDSVFYEKVLTTENLPYGSRIGLQFKVNLKGQNDDSRYYRFDVLETYEFHTPLPMEWYYDGTIHHISPPDYSKQVCWNTRYIRDIFVLATDNISQNEYLGLKLNFTDNYSQRLQHLYSLMIKQYAISKDAYFYWNQMRTNMHQSGGLYDNQPVAIKGNLINTTFADQEVLGYFSIASLKEKRIFIQPQTDITIIDNTCEKRVLRKGVIEIRPEEYPAFLAGDEYGWYPVLLSTACVDCRVVGGSTTKPDFWPY